MWVQYNANPEKRSTGDCVIRAISLAMDQSWDETYMGVTMEGLRLADMPEKNHVWGAYLRRHGFRRDIIRARCPECYTVRDFCRDCPIGVYILAIDGHVVCVIDGDYYDSFDSGDEVPIYYWRKENVRQ